MKTFWKVVRSPFTSLSASSVLFLALIYGMYTDKLTSWINWLWLAFVGVTIIIDVLDIKVQKELNKYETK